MKTNHLQLTARMPRAIITLLIVLTMIQCRGPRGPRGFDGDDGLDGIHYTHTAIYDVGTNVWDGDANGYFAWLDVPEITEDIFYNGAVLVYRIIEDAEDISFNMVPYTAVDGGLTFYLDYDAYIGGINLIYKEILDGVNDTFAPEDLMTFKVVIIEGLPLPALKDMVDVTNFSSVAKFLKIDVNKEGYHPF